jgi:hypothetical protein
MASACALAMFSGKNILNFAFVALCGALQTLFSREGYPAKTKPAKPAGLAGLKAIGIP